MPLVAFVVIMVVVGLLLYVVNRYVPMDGKVKQVMNVAVVIAVVLWVMKLFGVFEVLNGLWVGSR